MSDSNRKKQGMFLIHSPHKVGRILRRMHNIKQLKFYYAGLLYGLLGKKGIANKSFE